MTVISEMCECGQGREVIQYLSEGIYCVFQRNRLKVQYNAIEELDVMTAK